MVANRLWILGTVLLIAVMLLGTAFVGVAPQFTIAGANTLATQTVQAQNAGHAATLADLKKKFEDIDSLRQQLKEMQEAVPTTVAQSPLIDEIGDIAAANGVIVRSITFSDPDAYIPGDSTDPEVLAAAAGLTSGNFFVIPIEVTVVGTAAAVLEFLDDLQHGKRLILAHDITFEGTDDLPETDEARIILKGQIFVLTNSVVVDDTPPADVVPQS